MLRFLPDGWLEGLLRPFLLADAAAGLYLEAAAPDWRFALLVVFGLVVVLAHRGRLPLTPPQLGGLLSLLVMFYVWTFAIGNGRYFAAGLLLVGPLVVVVWRHLPGTRHFRVLALLGAVGLQAYTVQLNYEANVWGLLPWRQGAGLDIEASPVRETPAVFLTVTGISYSLLVPKFHRQSRWANVLGQRTITPALPEYPRLQALLRSPLPKYVVAPINPKYMSGNAQPVGAMLDFLHRSLAVHGLKLGDGPCQALRSNLALGSPAQPGETLPHQGFWFCPAQLQPDAPSEMASASPRVLALHGVFERIESRCPRFFPPGGGTESEADDLVSRHYPASDTRLFIDAGGTVYFKYFRAMNPTRVGRVDDVLGDRLVLACDKLPGRYQPPWARD